LKPRFEASLVTKITPVRGTWRNDDGCSVSDMRGSLVERRGACRI
jgi:hypothetical protein